MRVCWEGFRVAAHESGRSYPLSERSELFLPEIGNAPARKQTCGSWSPCSNSSLNVT